jgi:hypothetical protein
MLGIPVAGWLLVVLLGVSPALACQQLIVTGVPAPWDARVSGVLDGKFALSPQEDNSFVGPLGTTIILVETLQGGYWYFRTSATATPPNTNFLRSPLQPLIDPALPCAARGVWSYLNTMDEVTGMWVESSRIDLAPVDCTPLGPIAPGLVPKARLPLPTSSWGWAATYQLGAAGAQPEAFTWTWMRTQVPLLSFYVHYAYTSILCACCFRGDPSCARRNSRFSVSRVATSLRH